jgi:signal peptidase I
MASIRKIYFIILDFLQDIVVTLIMALALFLAVYFFLFRPFHVDGSSMYPNFLNDEYVFTNIIALRVSNPRFGDVVVFNAPPEPGKYYIKRIIGVPGDTVMVNDGNVYLNNKLLDESAYLKPSVKTTPEAFLKNNQAVKVPADEFFVLGDNRGESSDSREWGFVKKSEIIGISFFVYWPVTDMKIINNPY